jgi:hypothetical protein
MVGIAAFMVAGGLMIWLLERRKGDRYTGRVLLVGLPGLYLASLVSYGAPKWFYVPGLGLIAASMVLQIVIGRRQKAARNTAPPSNGSI